MFFLRISGIDTKTNSVMKATIKFATRELAEKFATDWSRFSLTGHIIGSGIENVEVKVFDITKEQKIWIDEYFSKTNL